MKQICWFGTSHGTGVVGGDERVVGLFECSHVGRDAQCLLIVLGQLLADVVEEALEDGRLLLVGELGNSSTILVEEVRLDGVSVSLSSDRSTSWRRRRMRL